MKKLLIVLSVFCYTATMVSAQVDDAVKVVNAMDEMTPAAKAAANDASITSKTCGKESKVCYMRKGEGDASTVVQWDTEQGKFVDLLDKDGKPVTCDTKAKTCSKSAKKECKKGDAAKTCTKKGDAAAKTCSKSAKKECKKGDSAKCCKKGDAAKTCTKKGDAGTSVKGTATKTCSHGAKGASATEGKDSSKDNKKE